MLLLTIISSLLTIPVALANNCVSTYSATTGCDVTYGNLLETVNDIRSVTECSKRCSGNDECLSVKFYPDTKICKLNSERYEALIGTCSPSTKYAKLTKNSCRKLIGENCDMSAECSDPNSQCFSGICQCDPGYSYQYRTESCLASCDTYGTTFTVYPGHKMYGHNDKRVQDIDAADDCMQFCVDETDFVCITVDYSIEHTTCFLTFATALTNPHDFMADGDITYYNRNCQ